jgi:hypothetical protein
MSDKNQFDTLLEAAASMAILVSLELELRGVKAHPEAVAVTIAAVLTDAYDDESEKRDEWTTLLLPLVRKHMACPAEV